MALAVYKAAEALDLAILIHLANVAGKERMADYHLTIWLASRLIQRSQRRSWHDLALLSSAALHVMGRFRRSMLSFS